MAWAARRPASDAPTMTIGRVTRSVLDRDRQHRTDVGRLERLVAQRGVDVLLPAQHVVVPELEDLGRDVRALAVALAQVHVDVDLGHDVLLSTMRSASSSGMASATCKVLAETAGWSPGPERSTSHSAIVFVSRPMPSNSRPCRRAPSGASWPGCR